MSDLQDALDRRQQIRDELYDPQRDAFDTIVEAARLVANPNIEAALTALAEALEKVVILPGRSRLRDAARATIEAALTEGETKS